MKEETTERCFQVCLILCYKQTHPSDQIEYSSNEWGLAFHFDVALEIYNTDIVLRDLGDMAIVIYTSIKMK